jgi:hypothetical protein
MEMNSPVGTNALDVGSQGIVGKRSIVSTGD